MAEESNEQSAEESAAPAQEKKGGAKIREMLPLVFSALALSLSAFTAYLQNGVWNDLSVVIGFDHKGFPAWHRIVKAEPDEWPSILIAESRAHLVFINNGKLPVVVTGVEIALQNPGKDGARLAPADRLSQSKTCTAGGTLGGSIIESNFAPRSIAPREVALVDIIVPESREEVDELWKDGSYVLACARFHLIDRNGYHEAVTPYMKFYRSGASSGGSADDRPSPESRAYPLLN